MGIALVSYQELSRQIQTNLERQIYLDTKSYALLIFNRINLISEQLRMIYQSDVSQLNMKEFYADELSNKYISDVYLLEGKKYFKQVYGGASFDYELNEKEENHLSQNKFLFKIESENTNDSPPLLYHASSHDLNDVIIVAVINVDEFLYANNMACVSAEKNIEAVCNVDGFPTQKIPFAFSSENKYKEFVYKDKLHSTYYWELFLGATFSPDSLFVNTITPLEDAYQALPRFRKYFILILLASLLIILLLAAGQVRRTIVPLSVLQKSAEKIKNGDYGSTIKLTSHDEFQDLSETFNEMSGKISDHFEMINAFTEIDKLIFSSLDSKSIITNLIHKLRSFLKTSNVGIIILNFEEQGTANFLIHSNDEKNNIEEYSIKISQSQHEELEECDTCIQLKNNSERNYLSQLNSVENENIRLFPLKNTDGVIGVLYINNGHHSDFETFEKNEIKELASKVAIALSNSTWEQKLYIQAHYDKLTGLPNRNLLQKEFSLNLEKAKIDNHKMVLILVGLDRFKYINDSYGHLVGDKLLVEVANILKQNVQEYDFIARYGGDEFIIVPDVKDINDIIAYIKMLSENILSNLERQITIDSYDLLVTPSLGISIFPKHGEDFYELLKNADAAMYYAKNKGRENYQYYSKKLDVDNLKKLELERDLTNALNNKELVLHYQPKISSQTGQLIGAEALLRWQHPRRGMVSPSEFIELAEETGLILPMSEWIFKTACKEAMEWQRVTSLKFRISVNLSPKQFLNYNIYDCVQKVLEESRLDPALLDLEITEGSAMDDIEKTIVTLHELKSLGVSLSIDDFGTGYSSMSYLQKFPVDILKIDQSFVRDIPANIENMAIVKSIISLAKSLSLEIVAEGVETMKQHELLAQLGCEVLQGYYFSKPLDAEDFRSFMFEDHKLVM